MSKYPPMAQDQRSYVFAASAVADHLKTCPDCPTGGCEHGLNLLRVESAAWTAFEQADPHAAAAYAVASGAADPPARQPIPSL